MTRRILHIINGYWNKQLYSLLISELSNENLQQTVFVPLRNKKHLNKFKVVKDNIQYLYVFVIKSVFYRIFFCRKIKSSIKAIIKETDIKTVKLSHSHTLFSDGAISYYFFKRSGVKYITCVRNTDLNVFFKYLFYLRPLGKRILLNSEKIVFLSEAYKKRTVKLFRSEKKRLKIIDKSAVIPNGINRFWHDNLYKIKKNKHPDETFNLIYAGEFRKNKNIHSIIESIEKLRSLGYNCQFTAVGLGIRDEEKYVNYLNKLGSEKGYIRFIKKVNKEELISIYRKSDIYIMPSYAESFGLVYAEALTQGLPVIYTKGEGFDNHFEDGAVGYSVNPYFIDDIVEKIELVIKNYEKIQMNCINASKIFKWSEISKKYIDIYNNIN